MPKFIPENKTKEQLFTFAKRNKIGSVKSRTSKSDLILLIKLWQNYKKLGKVSEFKPNLNITNYQYLFKDFDGDGIRNIDDQYPFDKNRNKQVEEINLSDILIKLKEENERLKKIQPKALNYYRKLIKKHISNKQDIIKITPHRVKPPLSSLDRVVKWGLPTISDKIGFTYLGKNYKDIRKMAQIIINDLNYELKRKHDYYRRSKQGYKAYHLIVKDIKNNALIEIQLKTPRIKRIADINHDLYKKGKYNIKNFKELINISVKADDGNKRSAEYIDNLTNSEIRKLLLNK